jgi:uncharacterized membrane protein
MTYDIHPILVHFPIAFLFIYSIIKILPFKEWFPKIAWRDIERVLLVIGILGAFASLATGDTAKDINRSNNQLVEAHSTFADIATWLYGALLFGEVVSVINIYITRLDQKYSLLLKITFFLEKVFCNKSFSTIIAFLGLISITLTGLLGGVLVYGTSADPLASIVLKILGISL